MSNCSGAGGGDQRCGHGFGFQAEVDENLGHGQEQAHAERQFDDFGVGVVCFEGVALFIGE